MYVMTGCWEGELISDSGRLQAHFSLTHSSAMSTELPVPALRFDGIAPKTLRLLEGARDSIVALAEAVPDPASGCLAQLMVEARVRGDRLIGRWLRRDQRGVVVDAGSLVAVRMKAAA